MQDKYLKKYIYLTDEAPYLTSQVVKHYHIPEWFAKRMIDNIQTHTYIDASISSERDTYPVILFSHGLLGVASSVMYLSILENLASNGYIIVGIDHTYFDN